MFQIGLHVVAVTSDGVEELWDYLQEALRTVNKIKHPSDPKKWHYFFADVSHLSDPNSKDNKGIWRICIVQ